MRQEAIDRDATRIKLVRGNKIEKLRKHDATVEKCNVSEQLRQEVEASYLQSQAIQTAARKREES